MIAIVITCGDTVLAVSLFMIVAVLMKVKYFGRLTFFTGWKFVSGEKIEQKT